MADEVTDTDRLVAYLSNRLDEHVVDTVLLEEGLNRVFRVATADNPRAYVVRQPHKSREEPGFIDIEAEHETLELLESTAVLTPDAVHFCEDDSVLGGPFSVIEYVEGEAIHWDEQLPDGYRDERSRIQFVTRLIDTLSNLHTVDSDQFAAVCGSVSPQVQVDRCIAQLEETTTATGHDPDLLWQVTDWLQANAPQKQATALVHGDYKPDNVFFTWTDRPRVSAVVDWETAKVRDPRTELGYLLFYWREAEDFSLPLSELAARHRETVVSDIRSREQSGFWPFTKQSGCPSRRDIVERWENATGLVYENDRFYRALGALMLATVWEGLYQNAIENEGDIDGWEAHIEYVVGLADVIIDGKIPL